MSAYWILFTSPVGLAVGPWSLKGGLCTKLNVCPFDYTAVVEGRKDCRP